MSYQLMQEEGEQTQGDRILDQTQRKFIGQTDLLHDTGKLMGDTVNILQAGQVSLERQNIEIEQATQYV